MSDVTCDLISGAIQQSGTGTFDVSTQESNYANTYINDLTLELLGSSSSNPDENVDLLRGLSLADVFYGDVRLFFSGRPNNPYWLPIKYDGTFYTEDAEKKRDEGRVCTGKVIKTKIL